MYITLELLLIGTESWNMHKLAIPFRRGPKCPNLHQAAMLWYEGAVARGPW